MENGEAQQEGVISGRGIETNGDELETPQPTAFDLEAYKKTDQYRHQKRMIEVLQKEGDIVGPDIDTMLKYVMDPNNRNRQPIHQPVRSSLNKDD